MPENILEIKNLTKFYGDFKAVDNLSLLVEKQDVYGFIGKNGAGKSTTIRTILNYLFQTEGTITVLGLDNIKDSKKIKNKVGYVPSEVMYYENLKIKDILNFSNKQYESFDNDYYNYLIQKFDINLEKKFSDLSYGNKKKVALVQALAFKPDFLILDEPSNGLDPVMQRDLFAELKKLNKEGMTIFLSTHQLKEIEDIANKVAIINDGIIVKEDSLVNIKKQLKKKVTIKSSDDIDLSSVTNKVIKEDNEYRFVLETEIKCLLLILSKYNINDLTISDISLDELFLEYYLEVK